MDISDLSIAERLKLMTEYRLARESRKSMKLWTTLGLPVPDDTNDAARVQATSEDGDLTILTNFLSECTRAKLGGRVQSSALFTRFNQWTLDKSIDCWTHKRFSMAMLRAGFRRKQSSVIWWSDLELIK